MFDGGAIDCFKKILRKDGWKGLTVGFNSCALYYTLSSSA
jgi:hypothetical protein